MQQDHPRITIVTPSFNQRPFIEDTIRSVLDQEYPNLEYIIIDGGSTDGSVDIIKKYENHLAYWVSEPDAGHYDAVNKGFRRATGDILAWLNSDDVYFPWTLKTVASIMVELAEVQWLTTLAPATIDYTGVPLGVGCLPGISREAFLEGRYLPGVWEDFYGYIQQESTFWRRTLWEKAGGHIRTEFPLAGDFDLWARFFLLADLWGATSPFSAFRIQAGQRSTAKKEYLNQAERALEQMRASLSWSPPWVKNMARSLRLHRVPRLRYWLRGYFGYSGKSVVRKNAANPDARWVAETIRF